MNIPFCCRWKQPVPVERRQYRERAFDDKREIGCEGNGSFPQVMAEFWNFGKHGYISDSNGRTISTNKRRRRSDLYGRAPTAPTSSRLILCNAI